MTSSHTPRAGQPVPSARPGRNAQRPDPAGLAMTLGCYFIWGFFPLYFHLIDAAGPVEIIGHRIVWTLVTCLVLLTVTRGWGRLRASTSHRPTLVRLMVAGPLVAVNWLVYVLAVNSGHTADAAIGYFLNPLVTVALAALVLRERLRRTQVVALAVATCAVVVLVVGLGTLPWMSLLLALSFASYSLVKKQVGGRVDALSGLTVETVTVAPVALGYLGWLAVGGAGATQQAGASVWLTVLLVLAGPVTAAPLLLFAGGARRVPLTTLGLAQYWTPLVQFLMAVWLFHEAMPVARWVAVGLVLVAVMLFALDQVRVARRSARLVVEF